jgi:NADH dehydrogenase FAD-containing subunit
LLNLVILAYTGGGVALAQLQLTPDEKGMVKGKGKIGFGLWRSVYLSKQVSWRNRTLVFLDWAKTQVFGRDITRL